MLKRSLSNKALTPRQTASAARRRKRRIALAAGLASFALMGWPVCASANDITIQFTTTDGMSGSLGFDTSGFPSVGALNDPIHNLVVYSGAGPSFNFFTLSGPGVSVNANKNSWAWAWSNSFLPAFSSALSLDSQANIGIIDYQLKMLNIMQYSPNNVDIVTTTLTFASRGNLFSGAISDLSINSLLNLTNASASGPGSVVFNEQIVDGPNQSYITTSYGFDLAAMGLTSQPSRSPTAPVRRPTKLLSPSFRTAAVGLSPTSSRRPGQLGRSPDPSAPADRKPSTNFPGRARISSSRAQAFPAPTPIRASPSSSTPCPER